MLTFLGFLVAPFEVGAEGLPSGCLRACGRGVSGGGNDAGPNDLVYLIGSKEASLMFRKKLVPVDAAIAGFIDEDPV